MNRILGRSGLALGLALAGFGLAMDAGRPDPEVGKSYRVPYRMTETNHFLVRVRIDGKGPFNFLVDTGAPALFVGTEAARKIGLAADPDVFFTPIGKLEFEGGASLTGMRARVEDPFQLVGMNALGLPGAAIDGILGFTALARFKIELDPSDDRMTWTRLDFEPKDPSIPKAAAKAQASGEMRAMNALGPIAKLAAALVGKQPEEVLNSQGFLGLALIEGAGKLRVSAVLADSPASAGGVRAGDTIVRIDNREVATIQGAHEAIAGVRPGDRVKVSILSDGQIEELTLTAGEGF